jgi:hypothetical protein
LDHIVQRTTAPSHMRRVEMNPLQSPLHALRKTILDRKQLAPLEHFGKHQKHNHPPKHIDACAASRSGYRGSLSLQRVLIRGRPQSSLLAKCLQETLGSDISLIHFETSEK